MRTIEDILQQASRLPPADRRRLIEELEERLDREHAGNGAEIVATTEEIPGQVNGFWFAPDAEIPDVAPGYRPTGAVLPRPDGSNEAELTCLDLVPIETAWLPLSEAGRYTYAHSEGLMRDERWRFRTIGSATAKAIAYEAVYAESLSTPAEVARLYGDEAARRSRPDRPIVQLRLRRLP